MRLAVDLGTSHTVAVVRRDDQPVRALLFDGSPLLPSGVYVDPDGTAQTGRDAERLAQVTPERFEPHPKRRVDEGSVLLGETEVPVPDLLAAVLKRIAIEASHAGADPAGGTVLTCPADWGTPRRDVLREAARRAGLGDVHLVEEPVAAATYCLDVLGQRVGVGQVLAVFDFGGGTLDVTVVQREPTGLAVLATGGLDDLGGLDVDAALVGHMGQLLELRDPAAWRRLSAPATTAELRDRRVFWNEVRGAKEMLSRASSAPVQVPGRDDALYLTREELDRVAGPLIARAVDETRRVLQRAGVGADALAGVFLVGGSSRIPLVASRLHARLGVAPTVPEQPELPVAHGALLHADVTAPGQPAPAPGGSAPAGSTPGRHAATPPSLGQPTSAPPVSGAPTPGAPASAPPGYGSPVSGPPGYGSPVSGPPGYGSPVSVPPGYGSPVSGPPGYGAPPVSPAAPGSPAPPYGPAGPGYGPGYPHPAFADQPGAAGYPPPGMGSPRIGVDSPLTLPTMPIVKRRRVALRVITPFVAMAVVLSITMIGPVRKWFGNTVTGIAGSVGTGTGSGNGPAGKASGTLDKKQDIALAGGGNGAVAVAGDVAYYAAVKVGGTEVVALPAAGGEPKWKTTVEVEPSEVKLSVVAGLVVLDAERVTTDNNKNHRAVLDTAGKLLWNKSWEGRRDLAYTGTDALVEKTGDLNPAVYRTDLRTGNDKWTRTAARDLLIIDARLAHANRTWPAGTGGADVTAPLTDDHFAEPLAASADVVMLDESAAKGYVLDPANGKDKASGALPLDNERWTVYGGLVIGKQKDTTKVGAYKLPNLAKAWEAPYPGGTDIERVRPCGPTLICVVTQAPSASDRTIKAYDLADGKEKWSRTTPFELSDPGWYVAAGKLIFGSGTFNRIGNPSIVDPADGSTDVRKLGQFVTVLTAQGNHYLTEQYDASGSGWTVAVGDVGSDKVTKTAATGHDQPLAVALGGDVAAVIGSDHHVLVLHVTL